MINKLEKTSMHARTREAGRPGTPAPAPPDVTDADTVTSTDTGGELEAIWARGIVIDGATMLG